MTNPTTAADRLAAARDASDKLRIIPASLLRSAEIRDAGKAIKAYLDAERDEVVAQVLADSTLLRKVLAEVADDDETRREQRRDAALFSANDLTDPGVLAEQGLWDEAMLEDAGDDELGALGLRRISADEDALPSLAAPGLAEHTWAMEQLYGPQTFGATPLRRQRQPA